MTRFAKKTGGYSCLSAVDIRVIALTYQLECETVGRDHIKNEPDSQVNTMNGLNAKMVIPNHLTIYIHHTGYQ